MALRTSILQFSPTWKDKSANLSFIEKQLSELHPETDLIVLPEMFNTGFSMDAPELAEDMNGPTIEKLKKWAVSYDTAISGSLIIKEDGNYYNRLVFITPKSTVRSYDKRHLFTLAKENETFTPGFRRPVWEYKDWRICPQICYDLRFPVWSRNTSGYDVLLYVASWPSKRHSAWIKLLEARAIENQCYVVACNRLGQDGAGFDYQGGSNIIDYTGEPQSEKHRQITWINATLDKQALDTFRNKLPFLDDRDHFDIDKK